VAEALLPLVPPFDPKFGNLHLLTVLIGSLVAVVVDWVIRQARHPALVLTPEGPAGRLRGLSARCPRPDQSGAAAATAGTAVLVAGDEALGRRGVAVTPAFGQPGRPRRKRCANAVGRRTVPPYGIDMVGWHRCDAGRHTGDG
jgi:hypothetical protein